jgi:hypothetical protein
MTKIYDKCYYVVATHNNEHYYTEGTFSETDINKLINSFDIDAFLADEAVDEEFDGPENGYYAVYRQATLSTDEAIDIGYASMRQNADGSFTISQPATDSAEIITRYKQRLAELEAEIGDDELVCLKQFA